MGADFLVLPFPHHSFSTVADVLMSQIPRLLKDFKQSVRGAARCIFLQPVMHFNHFGIKVAFSIQHFSGFLVKKTFTPVEKFPAQTIGILSDNRAIFPFPPLRDQWFRSLASMFCGQSC